MVLNSSFCTMVFFSQNYNYNYFFNFNSIIMTNRFFVDKNNPMVKWVSLVLDKFNVNDLVDDIIIGEVAPRTPKEAEARLLRFFSALQERTGYTPDMAMKDIKKFLH